MIELISILEFENLKYKGGDIINKLNKIIFPNNENSFADISLEEANSILSKELEKRLHQGTVIGNIDYLSKEISNNKINIDEFSTISNSIKTIIKNRVLINEKYL